ncbi:hypothetical protein BKG60_04935 [Mycobacterium syngnathidarum]|nr:hypothetical protein BKG60_04935 [Mycobacterium syngnathidarum]
MTNAYWNKDSGAVWVDPGAGAAVVKIAGEATSALAAYDALALAGFVRHGNWEIVPGASRHRVAAVTRSD